MEDNPHFLAGDACTRADADDIAKTAQRLHAEAVEVSKFLVHETRKLVEASRAGAGGAQDEVAATVSPAVWYMRKKALCHALGEARYRMLAHYDVVDRVLGMEADGYNVDVRNLVRKDYHRVMAKLGVLPSMPVVTLLGFHDEEKWELMNAVLNLGGAYSHKCARNTVTHVIANPETLSAQRGLTMASWDLPLVRKDWLTACARERRFVDHTPYLHDVAQARGGTGAPQPAPARPPRAGGGVVAGAPSTPGCAAAVFETQPADCTPAAAAAAAAAADGSPPVAVVPSAPASAPSASRRQGTPAPGDLSLAAPVVLSEVDCTDTAAVGVGGGAAAEGSIAFLEEVEKLAAQESLGDGDVEYYGAGGVGDEGALADPMLAPASAAAAGAATSVAQITDTPLADSPPPAAEVNPYLAGANSRRGRISRKEMFELDEAPPPAKRRKKAAGGGSGHDGSAGKSSSTEGSARKAAGSANTKKVDVDAADSEMERLPEAVAAPVAPKLPVTSGVESQKVKWDANASTPHRRDEQRLRQQATKRLFQMAGGGGVTRQVREALVRKIKDLGGEVELVPKYVPRSSHLLTLCATQQLTEKYLSFVASGKWIVAESYIHDSHEAGYWLEETDYTDDGPDNTIAYHRLARGGAFKAWKVILLLEPGGIHVILRAGGCTTIWNEITEENCREATHILSDTPGKELTLPTPKGADAALLADLGKKVFSIEILYRLLCVSIEEDEARQFCALTTTFT